MATATAYPTVLDREVEKLLGAPVPADQILSADKGKFSTRYTTDKFVIDRLDSVVGVGGWSEDYIVTAKSVTCKLTVLGVTKAAIADTDEDAKYGGPYMNAQARSFKRAAMKFGIARELWDKEKPAASAPARSGKPTASARPTSSSWSPSEKQAALLAQYHADGLELTREDLLSADRGGLNFIGELMQRKPKNAASAAALLRELRGGNDGMLEDDDEDEEYED